VPLKQPGPPRTPFAVPESAYVYLHAAALSESEKGRGGAPFQLEETGIDGRSFCFAQDIDGVRFYMSIMPADTANIGRGGTLLTSRQDAIRLRGIHEGVLNDLRLHGLLVPFPFGTVVQGWDVLYRRLLASVVKAREALARLGGTQLWNISLFVLDARFADLQKHDTVEKRRELDRHRTSFSTGSFPGRTDVVVLERVLSRQRRLAESVHKGLLPVVDRGTIHSMVSLEGGLSDDWKCILKSTYDVRPTMLTRFFRMVTDLQYQHILLEPMISLSGDILQATLEPLSG
jgi:hypothetical protein